MKITFDSRVHPIIQTRSDLFFEFNQSKEWKSGEEFFIESNLFRGKGMLLSRKAKEQNFPVHEPKYEEKKMIIRVVGHVKREVDLTELFVGGHFQNGIRGLPRPGILDIGLALARLKSPHFFINLKNASLSKPYIAAPLLGLLDDLEIKNFCGQSANYWAEYDLMKQPIQENWIEQVDEKIIQNFHFSDRNISSRKQKEFRQAIRYMPVKDWPLFPIFPYQCVAFELVDSALNFDDLSIHWKFANLIPFTVNLKKYVTEVPFSIFIAPRKNKKKPCLKHQVQNAQNIIPKQWQEQGFCEGCFPPNMSVVPDQFLFALTVRHAGQESKILSLPKVFL